MSFITEVLDLTIINNVDDEGVDLSDLGGNVLPIRYRINVESIITEFAQDLHLINEHSLTITAIIKVTIITESFIDIMIDQ